MFPFFPVPDYTSDESADSTERRTRPMTTHGVRTATATNPRFINPQNLLASVPERRNSLPVSMEPLAISSSPMAINRRDLSEQTESLSAWGSYSEKESSDASSQTIDVIDLENLDLKRVAQTNGAIQQLAEIEFLLQANKESRLALLRIRDRLLLQVSASPDQNQKPNAAGIASSTTTAAKPSSVPHKKKHAPPPPPKPKAEDVSSNRSIPVPNSSLAQVQAPSTSRMMAPRRPTTLPPPPPVRFVNICVNTHQPIQPINLSLQPPNEANTGKAKGSRSLLKPILVQGNPTSEVVSTNPPIPPARTGKNKRSASENRVDNSKGNTKKAKVLVSETDDATSVHYSYKNDNRTIPSLFRQINTAEASRLVDYFKKNFCNKFSCFKPSSYCCSSCNARYYCSQECQLDDWDIHAKSCYSDCFKL